MMNLFAAAALKVNQGMLWWDWSIVAGMIILLIGILFYCNRYVHSAADFLAASRCAGRYMISISRGIAGFAVVNAVATFEMFYKAGFASSWWAMLNAPIGLILSLFAWVTYRLRETRCFTLAQFYEVRYSRRFRIGAGMITFISGIVNYGIFPAVSVHFFMFFCRLPQYYYLWGVNWDVYAVLLTIAIGLGMFFATCGGQIAIMVTDFAQGVFCNICFIIFILFIFKLGNWDVSGGFVSWEQIEASLVDTHGISQINPFDAGKIRDFNYWYFLIGIFGMIYSNGAWQGGMGYAAAAKTPHESKMAGILAIWRSLAQGLMIMLFPLALIVIMKHPDFSDLAAVIQETLNKTENAQLREQGLVPTGLSLIMPNGLLGVFVAVMFAAMLSTDDTYMHSWGSIFIQDVIMPFRKKPFTSKQHIWALRLSVAGVAVFAWLFSYFYRQTEYVFLFFAITGAIVSGAGAAIIGGLYWKKGTTLAAWVSYVVGAGIATSGIVLQQVWNNHNAGIHFGAWLNRTFNLNWSEATLAKFPINGQYVNFIAILSCAVLYVAVSLIQHWLSKMPDFNLNKMLHRGEYDTAKEHVVKNSKVNTIAARLGITPEFTFGDKIIYAAAIFWTIGWFIVFIIYTGLHFFNGHMVNGVFESGVSKAGWLGLWHVKIYVTLILAVTCTIWFLCGGIIDMVNMFKSLHSLNRNAADNGTVVNGQNAGEDNSGQEK